MGLKNKEGSDIDMGRLAQTGLGLLRTPTEQLRAIRNGKDSNLGRYYNDRKIWLSQMKGQKLIYCNVGYNSRILHAFSVNILLGNYNPKL